MAKRWYEIELHTLGEAERCRARIVAGRAYAPAWRCLTERHVIVGCAATGLLLVTTMALA